MTFKARSNQTLLLWRMLFEPGQDKIGTEVKSTIRRPLVEAGLLEEFNEKSPSTGKTRKRFRLTDRAWSWAEANLDARLNRAPTAAPVLQAVLERVKVLLKRYNVPLVEFARPTAAAPAAGVADDSAQVRQAYLGLTGGRFNESMSLDRLRAALPELSRQRLDQALVDLFQQGAGVLYPEDNTRQLTKAMERAALRLSGEPKHYLKLEG